MTFKRIETNVSEINAEKDFNAQIRRALIEWGFSYG